MIYNIACDISSSLTNYTSYVFVFCSTIFALGFVLALFKKLNAQKLGFALMLLAMLFLAPATYNLFLKKLNQVKVLLALMAGMAVLNSAVFAWSFRIKRSTKDRTARILNDIMVIRPLSAALLSGTSRDTDLMKWETAIKALNEIQKPSPQAKEFIESSNSAYQAYLFKHYPDRIKNI